VIEWAGVSYDRDAMESENDLNRALVVWLRALRTRAGVLAHLDDVQYGLFGCGAELCCCNSISEVQSLKSLGSR
jgi:hypothetical protein